MNPAHRALQLATARLSPHMGRMGAISKPQAPPAAGGDDELASLQALDLETAKARRDRFQAHAEAARRVATYWFAMPVGATVPTGVASEKAAAARDRLYLFVALVGGAVAKAPGGFRVRVPITAAQRFEQLAQLLIEAFLVAFQRDGVDAERSGSH